MRETIASYTSANTVPFGISADGMESHLRFKEQLKLSFDLLTDDGYVISREYGAIKPDPDHPGQSLDSIQRTVIIVGMDGKVIFRQLGSPSTAELLSAILGPANRAQD